MSQIALGTMRIASLNVDEVLDLIHFCLEIGINKLDLADIYGRNRSEELIGLALEKEPELREKLYIQTKVGITYRDGKGYDSSYEYIVNNTKECLKRLKCRYLDSLLIHRPDIFMDNKEVAKAIDDLIKEGLIKDFGVSNFSSSEIEYLKKTLKTPIKYNQVSVGLGNTTMIDQTMMTNVPSFITSKESDDLFFYLKANDITIQAWSPFQFGFFGGSIFDKEKCPQIANALEKYAIKYQTTPCAIATAFLLKLDKNLWVITGSTNKSHIKECVDGEKINLTKSDWYSLYNETGHMLP